MQRVPSILVKVILFIAFLAVLDRISAPYIPGTYDEVMTHFGPPSPIVYSDYLPHTLPANVTMTGSLAWFQSNALGYRGPTPTSVDKPPHTVRVLFVGDSFTMGWGVEEKDTFIARIRGELGQTSPAVELINAGYHDGYSPDAYYAYLRREGMALKPDLVVIDIYTGNDVTDLQDDVWTSTDDTGAPISLYTIRTYTDYQGRFLNPSILSWNYRIPVLRDSHLFMFVTNIINHYAFPSVGIQQGRFGRSLSLDEAWSRFQLVTRATVKFCEEQHVPLLYVIIPLPGTTADKDPNARPMEDLIGG